GYAECRPAFAPAPDRSPTPPQAVLRPRLPFPVEPFVFPLAPAAVRRSLLVEPDVFHAPAVEPAVGHRNQPFNARLFAARAARIQQYRSRGILGKAALDLPNELSPLLRVRFHRLRIDQLVGLRVAVAGQVALRAADVVFIEFLARIIETAS